MRKILPCPRWITWLARFLHREGGYVDNVGLATVAAAIFAGVIAAAAPIGGMVTEGITAAVTSSAGGSTAGGDDAAATGSRPIADADGPRIVQVPGGRSGAQPQDDFEAPASSVVRTPPVGGDPMTDLVGRISGVQPALEALASRGSVATTDLASALTVDGATVTPSTVASLPDTPLTSEMTGALPPSDGTATAAALQALFTEVPATAVDDALAVASIDPTLLRQPPGSFDPVSVPGVGSTFDALALPGSTPESSDASSLFTSSSLFDESLVGDLSTAGSVGSPPADSSSGEGGIFARYGRNLLASAGAGDQISDDSVPDGVVSDVDPGLGLIDVTPEPVLLAEVPYLTETGYPPGFNPGLDMKRREFNTNEPLGDGYYTTEVRDELLMELPTGNRQLPWYAQLTGQEPVETAVMLVEELARRAGLEPGDVSATIRTIDGKQYLPIGVATLRAEYTVQAGKVTEQVAVPGHIFNGVGRLFSPTVRYPSTTDVVLDNGSQGYAEFLVEARLTSPVDIPSDIIDFPEIAVVAKPTIRTYPHHGTNFTGRWPTLVDGFTGRRPGNPNDQSVVPGGSDFDSFTGSGDRTLIASTDTSGSLTSGTTGGMFGSGSEWSTPEGVDLPPLGVGQLQSLDGLQFSDEFVVAPSLAASFDDDGMFPEFDVSDLGPPIDPLTFDDDVSFSGDGLGLPGEGLAGSFPSFAGIGS